MGHENSLKILLLYPPKLDLFKYGKKLLPASYPSTGLSYIYSYLKQNNYNCKIYDLAYDSLEKIKKILIREKADIIGITNLTEGRYNAFKLFKLIRKIEKDTIVIFGGHHPTYMCDQLLENFNIDFIVLGEGERKMLNLIRAINNEIPLESVEGIAYKRNGEIIKNLSKKDYFIKDLDILPFPFSEDQIELLRIYYPSIKIIPQQGNNVSLYRNEYKRSIGIISSRGCPFNCQFCSTTLFWGTRYRFRSPKNVVDEIEFYYKKFGFRDIQFLDDAFSIKPERCIDICKEIIQRNLKITFKVVTRADRVTDEMVLWLKKAGCNVASFGVESGSAKIRKTIHKNLSLHSIIRAHDLFRKNNISTEILLMIGNPGETNETISKTIALLKILKPDNVVKSLTTVFPGSELYELAKRQGFIDDKYFLTIKPPPIYTYENSLRTLKRWVYQIDNYDKNFLKMRSWIYSIILYTFFAEKFPWPLKRFLSNFYKKSLISKILREKIKIL